MTASTIEWTEQVWNPVVGCTVHSAGCTNCYAMRMANRLEAMATKPDGLGNAALDHYRGTTRKVNGKPVWTGKLGFSEAALLAPLRRKKPTRWFVNSMSDLFHAEVPDEWIDRVFAVMALCPQHTFQVLTKRSARMREYLTALSKMWHDCGDPFNDRIGTLLVELSGSPCAIGMWEEEFLLKNVWLGVSVEDQRAADERVPDLLATPAAVRWLSCEPLLGPVDLTNISGAEKSREYGSPVHGWSAIWRNNGIGRPCLDWVVVGGESGPGARPMHPDWARSLRDQCAAAGIPFFFKQWGEWVPLGGDDGWWPATSETCIRLTVAGARMEHGWPMKRVGKKSAGRLLDGINHDGMPS